LDRKALAVRAFREDPRFDPSLIREDTGHPWENRKWNFTGGLNFDWGAAAGTTVRFSGSALQSAANDFINPPTSSSDLESQAAVWYGRMAPVVGEFSLSTFLGELREGLPRLLPDIIRRANFARAAGSDYLNVEFGFKPLVDDLRNIAEILMSASYGLYRPLGAYHRQRAAQPIITFDRVELSNSAGYVATGDYLQTLSGIPSSTPMTTERIFDIWGSTVRRSTLKRWFEGEFVYIPKASFDPKNFFDRYETLMKVELTPSVLWELSPWSWLFDWFLQIGGAISAMEAGMDNRVLSTYYYAMEEFTSSVSLSVHMFRLRSGSSPALPSLYLQKSELHTKRRIRGNPFGFTGVSSNPLSLEQSAILGALGLTKTR
jgi:hypothetical protein